MVPRDSLEIRSCLSLGETDPRIRGTWPVDPALLGRTRRGSEGWGRLEAETLKTGTKNTLGDQGAECSGMGKTAQAENHIEGALGVMNYNRWATICWSGRVG